MLDAYAFALATELAEVGRRLANRGMLRATSGNLSVRRAPGFLITASGRDKSALTAGDFLVVDAQGRPAPGGGKPSAETGLHAQLYAWDDAIGAVLHVHSVAAAVLGRLYEAERAVPIVGWEMAKALTGVASHTTPLSLPVFPNDQDIPALAERIGPQLRRDMPGYLLAGHGLYAWGRDLPEAERHVDALDYLLTAELALLGAHR